MFIVATIYVVRTLVYTSEDVWAFVVGHWNQLGGQTIKLRRGTCSDVYVYVVERLSVRCGM